MARIDFRGRMGTRPCTYFNRVIRCRLPGEELVAIAKIAQEYWPKMKSSHGFRFQEILVLNARRNLNRVAVISCAIRSMSPTVRNTTFICRTVKHECQCKIKLTTSFGNRSPRLMRHLLLLKWAYLLQGLIDRNGSHGDWGVPEDPLAGLPDVCSRGQVHKGVRTPEGGPLQFLHLSFHAAHHV